MKQLLVVTNSTAGSHSELLETEIVAVLSESWDVSVADTSTPQELDAVLRQHPDVDVVAALGGDGSLHAVVQALSDTGRLPRTAVAVIPMGTGNDFARTINLPVDPVDAAKEVATGTIRPIDLIHGNGAVTINAAHVGLGADAAARAEPIKPWLGPLAYIVSAVSMIFSPNTSARVTIDGRELRGRVAQVAVGNGRFVGGGGELLPEAVIDDGFMDVAVSYAATPMERVTYVLGLRRGTHPREDFVVYTKARSVNVTSDGLRCTNDGEIFEPAKKHAWKIEPGGVRMLLP